VWPIEKGFMRTACRQSATSSMCCPPWHGLAAMIGACDSSGEPQPSEETLRMCQYDEFSVELTDGPNAGLRLEGTMFFIRDQPGRRGSVRVKIYTVKNET